MQDARDEAVSRVEVFGFLGWITSAVAYVLYLVWAYTPNATLEAHGVTYYPSKYWAVALPAWVSVTVVCVYWVYESLNMMATPSHRNAEVRIHRPGARFFSSSPTSGALPLVEIPPAVVEVMLQGRMSPLEAEAWYRGQQQPEQMTSLRGV